MDSAHLEQSTKWAIVLHMEHPGLFRKTRFQGEQSQAGAHDISVHTSVCELSPTVCGDVDRKSSLLLKDTQARQGDRGTYGQHAALAAVGIGGGAFQGCLCWRADLPLWLEWSLPGVWSLSLSVALLPTEHGRHCDCALGPPLHWLQDTRQGPASGEAAGRDALRARWLEEKPPDMDPVGSPKEPARQKHVLTCVRSRVCSRVCAHRAHGSPTRTRLSPKWEPTADWDIERGCGIRETRTGCSA